MRSHNPHCPQSQKSLTHCGNKKESTIWLIMCTLWWWFSETYHGLNSMAFMHTPSSLPFLLLGWHRKLYLPWIYGTHDKRKDWTQTSGWLNDHFVCFNFHVVVSHHLLNLTGARCIGKIYSYLSIYWPNCISCSIATINILEIKPNMNPGLYKISIFPQRKCKLWPHNPKITDSWNYICLPLE